MPTDDRTTLNDLARAPTERPCAPPPPPRVETGAMRFGDEPAGVYLDAERAASLATALGYAADLLAEHAPDTPGRATVTGALHELATLLSRDGYAADEVQQLRAFGNCLSRGTLPAPAPTPRAGAALVRDALQRENADLRQCLGYFHDTLDVLARYVVVGNDEGARECAAAFLDPDDANGSRIRFRTTERGGVSPVSGLWLFEALALAAARSIDDPRVENFMRVEFTVPAGSRAGERISATVTLQVPGKKTPVRVQREMEHALAKIAREGGLPPEGRAHLAALRTLNAVPTDLELARVLVTALVGDLPT
jgi:hypothetical protein